MAILLMILFALSVVGLALCVFKVQVDQRVVNVLIFSIIILLLIYHSGAMKLNL